MVKRGIEQEIRNKNFWEQNWKFCEERRGQESGNKTACTQNSWRLLAMGNQRAVCERRQMQFPSHDINKRGKVTPSNPSPNSFMRQIERKSSRTRSPRGRSPSSRTSRCPCKDYLRGTCNVKSGTLQNACSTRPRVVVGLEKSAHTHIVMLMNSRLKGPKRMMTKVQKLY